jgi:segregation and condensation protein B
LTEHAAAEPTIDLTADSPEQSDPEAATIDLTEPAESMAAGGEAPGNPDDPDDRDDSDEQAVEHAAELIEQIDAEVEASAAAEEVDDDVAPADEPGQVPQVEQVEQPSVDVPLRRVLEAVLLIAEEPLPVVEIATRLEVPAPDVETAIRELAAEYEQQERGFALREIAGGWRYYTAAACAPEVERFLLAGQTSRLSQAALETLAVVAYQQPVSRSRIAAVRGVSVDGVMKTLVSRGLVAESGTDTESGAIMYATTPKFLERLGLRDLSELPPLAPLLPGLDELPEE